MQRRPVAAGNWKMNTTPADGLALCRELLTEIGGSTRAEVVICPPFTHLLAAANALSGSQIAVGAQNMFWEPRGAYTGEISGEMIRAVATHVILGHSERRQYFGETDATVRSKVVAAMECGLVPIACVGESLAERDSGRVEEILRRQVVGALDRVAISDQLLLAYEPVWAIGTGRAATAEQANAAMGFIRGVLGEIASPALADRIRILYGGSVTAQNAAEFMSGEHVDGALVGGASLKADSFAAIVRLIGASAPA